MKVYFVLFFYFYSGTLLRKGIYDTIDIFRYKAKSGLRIPRFVA